MENAGLNQPEAGTPHLGNAAKDRIGVKEPGVRRWFPRAISPWYEKGRPKCLGNDRISVTPSGIAS